jgi:hypothetical protein
VRSQIPDSYLDLVNGPRVAALTTVMPDGQPQTTVVWCNFDGTHVLVNTMRGFRKEKNMRLNPRSRCCAMTRTSLCAFSKCAARWWR